jgi:hypothetical protein
MADCRRHHRNEWRSDVSNLYRKCIEIFY